MKITFFSNFLNHHQLPFCRALLADPEIEFRFVACETIPEDRLKLGYVDMNREEFVVRAYEDDAQYAEAMKLAVESDMVILGSCSPEFADAVAGTGKPFFRYSERLFKKIKWIVYLRTLYRLHKLMGGKKNRRMHMLCASAFTSADYAKVGACKGKCYRWGYFPEVKIYNDPDNLIENKDKTNILWVARFLRLKHPELVVLVAERLKNEGYDFTVNMIGTGEIEEEIKALIAEKGLEDQVKLLGSMPTEKVREYMEQAGIFLFTSDKQEGWGAVLNESMNSGCAVVASHAIGSVPFLLRDKENGIIYKDRDVDDLYNKVKYLLDNPSEQKRMGKAAYLTLAQQWNAENAAKRFVELSKAIIAGEDGADLFPDGVCSKAPIMKNNWYR